MKSFNTTGKCIPSRHYMVNIDACLDEIKNMIDAGEYFCINRGRQYGKTTTISLLSEKICSEYITFSLSFEGMGSSSFTSIDRLCYSFFEMLKMQIDFGLVDGIEDRAVGIVNEVVNSKANNLSVKNFIFNIAQICRVSHRPIVLIIDEVDQAGNYEGFIKFLGILRNMYQQRDKVDTFQSVILAGVYDIKNLKLKMRPDDKHQYNSPWNIAADFNVDMSLHAGGISLMLEDYAKEHGVKFDADFMANEIYQYTRGYPFLVSRLCQLIDVRKYSWDRQGLLEAIKDILNEKNTLFDDMAKKLDDFPKLRNMLSDILFCGTRKKFEINYYPTELAVMFGYVYNYNGDIRVSNRLFEIKLYNIFAADDEENDTIYREASKAKNEFIAQGKLNMVRVLQKFVEHYNEIYSNSDYKFLEKMGRKLFLLYLRPIINGTGNYYVEAETRDETRTDVIVDYLGQQYVIEMKIWHGDGYNQRGEQQIIEYLDYYHLQQGYLLSFSFNKGKKIGVREIHLGDKVLYEAIC